MRFGLGNGSPDIVGILKPWGRFFGVETKTEDGRLSKAQKLWHERARVLGAFVGVARSLEEAIALLNAAREDTAARWQPVGSRASGL